MSHQCQWREVAGDLFMVLLQDGVGGQDFSRVIDRYRAMVKADPTPGLTFGKKAGVKP